MAIRGNNRQKPSNSIKDTASKILAEKGISYECCKSIDEPFQTIICAKR